MKALKTVTLTFLSLLTLNTANANANANETDHFFTENSTRNYDLNREEKAAAARAAAEADDYFSKMNTRTKGVNINAYAGEINNAIKNQMSDEDIRKYKGKTCTIRIRLAKTGGVTDAKIEGGDPELCRAALKAAQTADIPAPPSQVVYEVFKNAPLDFKP